MIKKSPAVKGVVTAISVLVILIPVVLGIVQRVSKHRILAPVKVAISIASESGLEYPEARPVSEEMRARYEDEGFAYQLEQSVEQLRLEFDEDEEHSPEIAYWLAAGLMASGNLETARAAVDICRVHHPYDQDMWILDAVLFAAEGDSALTRDRLEALIEKYPANRLARRNLEKLPE